MALVLCIIASLGLAAIAGTNWVITRNESRREGNTSCRDAAPVRWMLSAGALLFVAIGAMLVLMHVYSGLRL